MTTTNNRPMGLWASLTAADLPSYRSNRWAQARMAMGLFAGYAMICGGIALMVWAVAAP